MCPNTCFLITCTDKRCVLFESCGPVPNSITKTICCIVLLCCHATLLSPPQFYSPSLVYLRLPAAVIVKRMKAFYPHENSSSLQRPPLTCCHVKVNKGGQKIKKSSFCRGEVGGRNGVCLRERIRARPSRHTQELLGAKVGRVGHTHVSCLTVWACLSCLTAAMGISA